MERQQKSLFDTAPEPWEVDSAEDRQVATVVLPEAPYGPYDYLIPEKLRGEVEPGRRVNVPLGRGNRNVVGYVVKISDAAAIQAEIGRQRWKEVSSVVDERPLLTRSMLRLTEWMADYYLCPWGQVLEGVVPAGVRAQAGTREVELLTVPTHVAARLTMLKLPKKQAAALKILAGMPNPLTVSELARRADCGTRPIRELVQKGLIQIERRRVMQFESASGPRVADHAVTLNSDQALAFNAVKEALFAAQHRTILVHGVTGSGKTELYMRSIEEVVAFRRQAIVLVPEISLTPQTTARFRARFDHVAVLHSHLSPVERHAEWRRIADGEVHVVVGARSAVFAPTPHLGLIVIDEEHDSSFKQDSPPRYHARTVALERAKMEQVPVLLGSATPSLESWHAAKEGSFQLVELPSRILNRPLPDVGIIDLRAERPGRLHRGAISRQLYLAMVAALREQGQIILLLNRRGFSTSIQCPACGYVARCPDCELALTHHRTGSKAVCHYCDYEIAAPAFCPECRFDGLHYVGLGTQKLEAEVRARFQDASVLRMDSDTMKKPGSHEQAFRQFREGAVQILVGTQMIAKGLDFPNVTLVGVINADTALHFPDFRASERTFQLVTQVAGRTGRGERGGRVLVQTLSPDHPAIISAARHDFAQFAAGELPIRLEHGYSPFASMVRLIIRGPQERPTELFAEAMGNQIRQQVEEGHSEVRVLGPAPAPIAKLRGNYRFHILLQGRSGETLRRLAKNADHGLSRADDILWQADVDPIDML